MGVASFGEISRVGAVDSKGVRTYTRKFLVVMDTTADAPPLTWAGLPIVRYDPYPTDLGALAVSLRSEAVNEAQGIYHVEYEYTSAPFDEGNTTGDPTQTDQSTEPTARPWVIKFGSTHGTRLLTKDLITDLPVANSAGVPFDPPPEVPTSNLTMTITAFKDWDTFDPVAKILLYQDAVNDSDVLFAVSPATLTYFPKGSLRCTDYGVTSANENGQPYWQCDITIEYRRDLWNPLKILDCGTLFKQSAALPPQPILDRQGNPVGPPGVPLDGSGRPLNAGADPVYRPFSGYYEKNFTTILA